MRRAHFDALPQHLSAHPHAIDFVEVVAETFVLGGPREDAALAAIAEHVPVIAHGVSTSLGGPSPLDRDYLRALESWLDRHGIAHFSEHMSWSSAGGAHSLELLPLPFTSDAARWLGTRAAQVADILERPIWLENTTFYAVQPGSDRDVVPWTSEVLERSSAGFLLDLANLWVNAVNHGRDARHDLMRLPLDRVTQVHLAGSRFEPAWQVQVDDHASAIPEAVLDLYAVLLGELGRLPLTLVEWDQNVPPLGRLLAEVERVRSVATRALKPAIEGAA